MAQTYKTEGIVLKRWDYKEKDRMVKLFTRDFGKLTTRAISARKQSSKLAGHLEPFVHSDFHIAKSKTIDIIAGSNTINPHRRLRESIHHNALASYFLEVVDLFTDFEDADPELYDLVKAVLHYLDTHPYNALVIHSAIIHLFSQIGYSLDLHTCHSCRKPITEGENKIDYGLWSVECHSCSTHEASRHVSDGVLKILRFLQREPFAVVAQLQLPEELWQELHETMRSLIQYHGHREIVSERVMTQLLVGSPS